MEYKMNAYNERLLSNENLWYAAKFSRDMHSLCGLSSALMITANRQHYFSLQILLKSLRRLWIRVPMADTCDLWHLTASVANGDEASRRPRKERGTVLRSALLGKLVQLQQQTERVEADLLSQFFVIEMSSLKCISQSYLLHCIHIAEGHVSILEAYYHVRRGARVKLNVCRLVLKAKAFLNLASLLAHTQQKNCVWSHGDDDDARFNHVLPEANDVVLECVYCARLPANIRMLPIEPLVQLGACGQ